MKKQPPEKDTGKYKDYQNYNKSLIEQKKPPITYQYYVDNIAAKFDLGKMLFGDGGGGIPENTPPPILHPKNNRKYKGKLKEIILLSEQRNIR